DEDGWNEETMNFVMHAIFILGELQAYESINTLFHVLSQSEKYLELYIGDFIVEILWEPVYKIASNNLQLCKEFLFKPGINTYARTVFPEVVVQIALHHPERMNEILDWFNDVIQFFLNSNISDNVIDSDLNAFIICYLIDLKANTLLPEIEKMFEKGIVLEGICGSWSEVNEALTQPDNFDNKRDILSIVDRYKNITETWAGYNEEKRYGDINFIDQFDTPSDCAKTYVNNIYLYFLTTFYFRILLRYL
ncbi:MAG: DUF1186 domain-containing protein, partial [Winogradskyella sp.]|uniref:DUF1186 domain-containing protein n=1 Tax=Winogradskyella sp. TaxID=1883156 RepID=UPI0017AE33EE|nr:DUF1186 domain-containing protein [Winogradskyella sp.]